MALAVASSTRATGGGWLEQPHEQGLVPVLPLSQGGCCLLFLSLLKTVKSVGQAVSAEASGGFGSTFPAEEEEEAASGALQGWWARGWLDPGLLNALWVLVAAPGVRKKILFFVYCWFWFSFIYESEM